MGSAASAGQAPSSAAVAQAAAALKSNGSAGGLDQEALIQFITERVMAELAKR
jgi:hypothetical protein